MRITLRIDPTENRREWEEWQRVYHRGQGRFNKHMVLDDELYEVRIMDMKLEQPSIAAFGSPTAITQSMPYPVLLVELEAVNTHHPMPIVPQRHPMRHYGQGIMQTDTKEHALYDYRHKPLITNQPHPDDRFEERVPQDGTETPPVAGIDLG